MPPLDRMLEHLLQNHDHIADGGRFRSRTSNIGTKIARIERAAVNPFEAHTAAGRLGETVETAKQRGLARAGGATRMSALPR